MRLQGRPVHDPVVGAHSFYAGASTSRSRQRRRSARRGVFRENHPFGGTFRPPMHRRHHSGDTMKSVVQKALATRRGSPAGFGPAGLASRPDHRGVVSSTPCPGAAEQQKKRRPTEVERRSTCKDRRPGVTTIVIFAGGASIARCPSDVPCAAHSGECVTARRPIIPIRVGCRFSSTTDLGRSGFRDSVIPPATRISKGSRGRISSDRFRFPRKGYAGGIGAVSGPDPALPVTAEWVYSGSVGSHPPGS